MAGAVEVAGAELAGALAGAPNRPPAGLEAPAAAPPKRPMEAGAVVADVAAAEVLAGVLLEGAPKIPDEGAVVVVVGADAALGAAPNSPPAGGAVDVVAGAALEDVVEAGAPPKIPLLAGAAGLAPPNRPPAGVAGVVATICQQLAMGVNAQETYKPRRHQIESLGGCFEES